MPCLTRGPFTTPVRILFRLRTVFPFTQHPATLRGSPAYKSKPHTFRRLYCSPSPSSPDIPKLQHYKMTSVLPILPRTPSSLLAALCLSPVLAPLNASQDLSQLTTMPHISLLPPTPPEWQSTAGPDSPEPENVPHTDPPLTHTLSFRRGSQHRLLTSNEARQLTLFMAEHLHPVKASSKGLMQKSIHIAEVLHQQGIRWDRHRRVMGTHIRSIWEEGLRLSGGDKSILRLSQPGPME